MKVSQGAGDLTSPTGAVKSSLPASPNNATLNVDLRRRFIDAAEVMLRELDINCAEILLQMMRLVVPETSATTSSRIGNPKYCARLPMCSVAPVTNLYLTENEGVPSDDYLGLSALYLSQVR